MCDKKCFSHGLLAGLMGGIAYCFFLLLSGMQARMNNVIGTPDVLDNLILHFIISIAAGLIFAYLLGKRIHTWLAAFLWGLGFGLLLWFLGPMTFSPLLHHGSTNLFAAWNSASTQVNTHALIGWLIYGGIVGLVYCFLKKGHLHKLKVPKH